MASAQAVETSVTNNSPSQDSNHPENLFQSRLINVVSFLVCHLLVALEWGSEEVPHINNTNITFFKLCTVNSFTFVCTIKFIGHVTVCVQGMSAQINKKKINLIFDIQNSRNFRYTLFSISSACFLQLL